MIRHLLKIIWNQRLGNAWVFGELLIVAGVLWIMLDVLLLDVKTYNLPLGYDIENTHRLKLGKLSPDVPGYVEKEETAANETDDLLRLMEQIRMSNDVEEVCAAFYSCPYSFGNSWNNIRPLDGDTAAVCERSFHVRRVTPEYFTVFRVKDKNGNPIAPQLDYTRSSIVLSKDLEALVYGHEEGKGRRIKHGDNEEVLVSAVSQPVRPSDYEVSEPCYFDVLIGKSLQECVEQFGSQSTELCIRMKQPKSPEEMNRFLESMGDLLVANSLYVYGYKSIEQRRQESLYHYQRKMKIKVSLMFFMLVNVFFGIVGTFWLRTQYRRQEIGLRVALGSSKNGLYRSMNMEGLLLLLFTLPCMLVFAINLYFFDLYESSRFSLSAWRFLSGFGGAYLLMAGMVCLGVSFPARKAVAMPPAEALHYE
ncbi:MAG: multidrug ABC transporter substrate-binding protein [Tannerellaceae bacterium]|nr:multidrug ABC transporter substrate-binding protein [Tannerellaceae bacterium]